MIKIQADKLPFLIIISNIYNFSEKGIDNKKVAKFTLITMAYLIQT